MFSRIISSFTGQVFVVLLGLAIVSACSMRGEHKPVNSQTLNDTHWALKSLTGYDTAIMRAPTLHFTQNRLSGFNGCNRIFANYAAGSDGTIAFGQLGSTKMACMDAAGALERTFNQQLAKAKLFAISRDALNIMDGERNVLMALTPKAPE